MGKKKLEIHCRQNAAIEGARVFLETVTNVQFYQGDIDVEPLREEYWSPTLYRWCYDFAVTFRTLVKKLRVQVTLGYRKRLIESGSFKLWGEAGGGGLYEDFGTGRQDTDVIGDVGFEFEWKFGKAVLWKQTAKIFPTLTGGTGGDAREFRVVTQTTITTPISATVSLNLSVLYKYNSNPVRNVPPSDIKLALTLNFKFTAPPEEKPTDPA